MNKFLFFLFGLLSFINAQKKTDIYINHVSALPPVKGQLMAGSAIRDITPPPGLPTSARSITGNKNIKGFRTRLKARICCLRDKEGTTIALVQLDLAFGSLTMHHAISEEIAKKTDIPISNVVLSCTHTHSGPGGFFSNNFFNAHASALPGFDLNMYTFLTNQIISGILEAYKNMKPAKIATGKIDLYGVTRNRSINSYIKNKGNEELNKKDASLVLKSINPSMYMLRVDTKDSISGEYKPLYAFTTFSIHGTAIADEVDVFNADVFAYAQRELPWNIKNFYAPSWEPIHAFSNGTEGDVAPNLPLYNSVKETKRVPLDWIAAKNIGKKIADASWELFKNLNSKLKDSINIRVAAREVDLNKNNTIDSISICKYASVGSATVGGALENRSFFSNIPLFNDATLFTRKWFYRKNSCNGNKNRIIGPIQRFVIPKKSFPKDVMFQLIQINDLLLVPLPWEITTSSGRRIEEYITKAYKNNQITPPKYIAISSLANDYMGYATTPEEFFNQAYEGGQTLYGKNTTPYISLQLYHLTNDLLQSNSSIQNFPNSWHYVFKTKNRYPPENSHHVLDRAIIQNPVFQKSYVIPYQDLAIIKEGYWSFSWKDEMPSNIKIHNPIVVIEESEDGINWHPYQLNIQPIDDEGYDIEVRLEKMETDFSIYKAKWYNPILENGKKYRFMILPRNNHQQEKIYSKPFVRAE